MNYKSNIFIFSIPFLVNLHSFSIKLEAASLAVQGMDNNAALTAEPHLADSLAEALKSLKEGSGILQEPIPPEELSGMFSGLNLDDVSVQCLSAAFWHLTFHISPFIIFLWSFSFPFIERISTINLLISVIFTVPFRTPAKIHSYQ